MKLEELVKNLLEEKDYDNQKEIFKQILKELNNLDHIYVGLSDKKVVEDDSARKPAGYEYDGKTVISIFSQFEYAKDWALHYNRSIGIVSKENDFNLLYIMANMYGVEYISLNEGTDIEIALKLNNFIEENNMKPNYLFKNISDSEDGSNVKLDFNLIEKLDLNTYKLENKEELS